MPALTSSALGSRAPRAGTVSSRRSAAVLLRSSGGSSSSSAGLALHPHHLCRRRCRRPSPSPPVLRALSSPSANDDEEIIPLLRPPPTSFSDEQLEKLAHPHLLKPPGSTVGEELEALRELYLEAEDKALKGEAKLFTENWEGDVYVGSGWNVATVLALVSAVTTLGGLVFAFATKGVLWGLVDYYGY